jgi:opacity protein-like surface antigen
MKKALLLMTIAVVVGTTAYAAPEFRLSAGLGGDFQLGWMSMKYDPEYPEYGAKNSTTSLLGGGFLAFFDATYAELDVGMNFITQKQEDADEGYTVTSLTIGLLGKYPIALGEKLTLAPMVGFDYDMWLSYKATDGDDDPYKRADDDDDAADMDSFWIKVGAGADFALTDAIYLRGTLLWGFKLNNKSEKDSIDFYDKNTVDLSIFTHGPTIKLAVGYKF